MLQVLAEMERAARVAWPAAARFRMEWDQSRPGRGVGVTRATARWLGDGLVTVGERLRAWSTAEAPPARAR
jgi:hypothetical protein